MAELPTTVRSSRARTCWETLRHLRPGQTWLLLRRRLVAETVGHRLPRRVKAPPSRRPGPLARVPFLLYPPATAFNPDVGELTLLNRTVSHRFPPDWDRSDQSPRWNLELQYFHWMSPKVDAERGLAYLSDWVRHQPSRSRSAAWNPFGLAMRVLQWTRVLDAWGAQLSTHADTQLVLASLYRQARFLAKHQRFELPGNQLIKTAAGLYAAGRFFAGTEAEAWERRAAGILLSEARAQTLPDGGHYERSPMYQIFVLVDLLDVLNLTTEESPWRRDLAQIVARQVAVVGEVVDPLGDIPLTNDSVLDQAPAPAEVLRYARTVLGTAAVPSDPTTTPPAANLALPDFGLYRLTEGPWYCWIDAGLAGPDFLPAHAHSDLGSVLAWIDRRPFLVEAGICEYGGDPERRAYDRNAYGHNVLILDGRGVCECWGDFLVGRRARHVDAHLRSNPARLTISHDGFAFLPGAPHHQREIEIDGLALRVVDQVRFHRPRPAAVEVVWHLDPSVRIQHGETGLRLSIGARQLAVECRGQTQIEVCYWPMARRLSASETGPVLVIRAEPSGTCAIETVFRPVS